MGEYRHTSMVNTNNWSNAKMDAVFLHESDNNNCSYLLEQNLPTCYCVIFLYQLDSCDMIKSSDFTQQNCL